MTQKKPHHAPESKNKASDERITRLFEYLAAAYPTPTTELFYTNTYTLLVAVVLSTQATDAGVNKATPALFEQADTPQKMLTLGEEKLCQLIKTIGLYPTKARHIIALSQLLCEQFGAQVPNTREDLMTLPGVGRKTANVVLNVAFDQPTLPVDTHVFRVAQRLGLAQGKTPLEIEQQLEDVIPERWKRNAHHLLILHGRAACKARTPLCQTCCVNKVCPSFPLKRT